jgi:hypothetical protein
MKTAIVMGLGLLNFAAWWVAYENRESEKVLSAFASISVGALGAVLLAVFVFAEQPKIKSQFPVTFFVDSVTGVPAYLPSRSGSILFTLLSSGINSIKSSNPTSFSRAELTNTYHQLLQRLIIDWIRQVYRAGWQVTKQAYDLPAGEMFTISPPDELSAEKPTLLDEDSIATLFPANGLGRNPITPTVGIEGKMVLPPTSTLRIIAPRDDIRAGEVGEIIIRNRYVNIEIKTRSMGVWSGIGEYAVLGGYDNLLADKVSTVTYELTFESSYPGWLSGSPKMASRRTWAEAMLKMLQEDFDEQAILRKSRENKNNPKMPPGGFMTESAVKESKAHQQTEGKHHK